MFAATSMRRAVAGRARARRRARGARRRAALARVAAALALGERVGVGVDRRPCPRRRRGRAACRRRRRAAPAPSPTTAGMPSARARIAACDGRAAAGGRDAPDEVAVERRGLAGRQVVGDEDARARRASRPPRRCPARWPQHAAADVVDVGGALAQVRVVEPAVVRAAAASAAAAQACAALRPAVVDRAPRRVEQRGVVEQQQVGVEDRRLGLAGRWRRPPPRAAATSAARRVAGRVERAPLVRRVARRARSETAGAARAQALRAGRSRCRATRARRAAARRRRAGAPARRAAPRPRRRPRRRPARGAVVVAEVVVGQRARSRPAPRRASGPLARTRISWPWRDAERGQRGEAARVGRARARSSRCDDLDRASSAGRGLDEPRRRAGRAGRAGCRPRAAAPPRRRRRRPGLGGRGAAASSSPPSLAELRGLRPQRRRAPRPRPRRAPRRRRAGRGRRDRALDQRRLGRARPRAVVRAAISTAISALISALPRSISTSTPSRRGAALDRLHARPIGVGADRAGRVGHAARGLDRDVLAAHLARELDHALGQRRAVRDDDEPDHAGSAARRRGAGSRPGAPLARPVAFSMCQRHVSESHTARSGAASRDLPEQRGADLHRDRRTSPS